MRAVRFPGAGLPSELVEREIPEPGAGWVRIKVQACGICPRDSLGREGQWLDIAYPRVPGHEVAGTIDAVGAEVAGWKPGQRVGVGWYGGYWVYCESCRRGDFIICHQAGVSRAFVRVVGHSLRPSRQNFTGAILRRDVIAAESLKRQGDLQ